MFNSIVIKKNKVKVENFFIPTTLSDRKQGKVKYCKGTGKQKLPWK